MCERQRWRARHIPQNFHIRRRFTRPSIGVPTARRRKICPLAFVPTVETDRDLSHPRSSHFWISSGRVRSARQRELGEPFPPRFAAHPEAGATSSARNPPAAAECSRLLPPAGWRSDAAGVVAQVLSVPDSLAFDGCRIRARSAGRRLEGLPEIAASLVTSFRRPISVCSWLLFVPCLYSLTRSVASLDQGNTRRLVTPSVSPILLRGLAPDGS
jgi:hypothetical protein